MDPLLPICLKTFMGYHAMGWEPAAAKRAASPAGGDPKKSPHQAGGDHACPVMPSLSVQRAGRGGCHQPRPAQGDSDAAPS